MVFKKTSTPSKLLDSWKNHYKFKNLEEYLEYIHIHSYDEEKSSNIEESITADSDDKCSNVTITLEDWYQSSIV